MSQQSQKATYSYSPFENTILRDGEVIAKVEDGKVDYINKKYRLMASKVSKALNLCGEREATRAAAALASEENVTETTNGPHPDLAGLMKKWNNVSHGLKKSGRSAHEVVNE